jgi:uncharacterized membrane protein YozB (DUF420 family)
MTLEPTTYPAINAVLNATSAVLIGAGRYFIARKRVTAHRNCMIAAVCTSSLFLVGYLYYHFAIMHGVATKYQGVGAIRIVYFAILLTHTILAVAVVPLVIAAVWNGLKDRREQHRRIVRWTYPIWMYVSITGVIIYIMLYRL